MWKLWLVLLLCGAALAGWTFAASWWQVKPAADPPGRAAVPPDPVLHPPASCDAEGQTRTDAEPFCIGRDVTAPVLLGGQRARYTELAFRAGLEGTVTVEAIVDEQGRVANARVLKGLPMGLDAAALKAVKSWRFKPATLAGQPVTVYDTLTVDFILRRSLKPAPESHGPADEGNWPFADVFRIEGDVTAPVFLGGPQARYTEVARRARVQGRVILEAVIDEQGRVVNTHILKPLPLGLDQKAIEAVKTWRFKPATLKGKPVKVFHALTVDFTLPP